MCVEQSRQISLVSRWFPLSLIDLNIPSMLLVARAPSMLNDHTDPIQIETLLKIASRRYLRS